MVEIEEHNDVACEPSNDVERKNFRVEKKIEVNTASFFATELVWKDKKEMINWVMAQARKSGFIMTIGRSNVTTGPQYVQFDCERGSSYDKRSGKNLKREGTGSRKCHCPFRLKGYIHLPGNNWYIIPTCGIHNHEMESKLEGHLHAGRITDNTKKVVQDLTKSLVQPKHILINLKQKDEENETNIKQVYNVRHRFRIAQRGNKSELQHLVRKLEEHQYVHFTRTKSDETKVLQDIFWAQSKSIMLLNTFPTVLIMDSTYKTNKYKLHLFEIVGVTSTYLTYSVGFAFLANEKKRQLHLGSRNVEWSVQFGSF